MKSLRALFSMLVVTAASLAAGAADIPAPEDVAAVPADAAKSESGLAWKVLEKGTGTEHPASTDVVTVHYTGWTTDGKMFDSSVARGRSITFPLNKLITGWGEGVPMMVTGEKRRLWIPEELAYKGRAGAPAGMLVFDIELIDFQSLKAPSDVAAPPADAEKGRGGLRSKVLHAGTGKIHPDTQSVVTVNYIGWKTDGFMFDTSFNQPRPAKFQLNQVIRGWTEGLQLMVEGERRRFWIPEGMAYEGKQEPRGMLVFDVELIAIE
ncbi:MAG: FKBP-type peptidyl-prolyl cis-trans isomerase [Acidobacteria bacterium]|nr:FKBP-type peptidyl-prolyl cis-trans isomerase [Acidobacteriota bacterium]